MVLQRDKPAIIWGYTEPGANVSATLLPVQERGDEETESSGLTTTADNEGLWRIKFPPQRASLKPFDIHIQSDTTTGHKSVLENVLFGDVYMCSGQSNMQFSLPDNFKGEEEATRGDDYPHIRLFTNGRDTESEIPLPDLQSVLQPWTEASKTSLYKPPNEYFSAVCWFFGREIADGLNNQVPIGLISNSIGGSYIAAWQPNARAELYNAMVAPYSVRLEHNEYVVADMSDALMVVYSMPDSQTHTCTPLQKVGPMVLSGFAWYQGEGDAYDESYANRYKSHFTHMIEEWRDSFAQPDLYFGFIQISVCCDKAAIAELRAAQLHALTLKKVGYATNADRGDGCNMHPPMKQDCGARLGRSALALQYGQSIHWKSPIYDHTQRQDNFNDNEISIIVQLQDVSAQGVYLMDIPFTVNPNRPSESGHSKDFRCEDQSPGICAGAKLLLNNDIGWVDATIRIVDTSRIMFVASISNIDGDFMYDLDNSSILAISYGWGPIPLMTVYDKGTELPLLPFQRYLNN